MGPFSIEDGFTVGYIDLTEQEHDIKMIKLGFDFDFNPVCFIATVPISRVADNQFKKKLNSRLAPLTTEERTELLRLEYQCDTTMDWSRQDRGYVSETIPDTCTIYGLKGTRPYGLSVDIEEFNIHVWIRSEIFSDPVWTFGMYKILANGTLELPSMSLSNSRQTGYFSRPMHAY